MEKFIVLLIPFFMAVIQFRLFLMPIRLFGKLTAHSICGFLCLWLLNTIAPFTGVFLPVNGITVLTAGTLGLPGIGIIALLAVL